MGKHALVTIDECEIAHILMLRSVAVVGRSSWGLGALLLLSGWQGLMEVRVVHARAALVALGDRDRPIFYYFSQGRI